MHWLITQASSPSVASSLPPLLGPLLSLILAAAMSLIGIGVGDRLLSILAICPSDRAERIALTGAFGLGALGYAFLALGLVGLLRPWPVWVLLAAAAAWAYPQFRRLWSATAQSNTVHPLDRWTRTGIVIIALMVFLVLLRGLAPVTDYDGLAYHLVVPADYLTAGHVFPTPGEAHANFPLTVELLFVPAISVSLENSARLIHLAFGVLLGIGTFALGVRVLGSRRGGWLAVLVLGTTPILGTIGAYAHHDLGWALFEFVAIYALVVWSEEGDRRWLALAGVFAGLGLGSKYLGLPAFGVLGLTLLIDAATRARKPWHSTVSDGLLFGSVAMAVALPWYLKNWIWLGNPVYPLWFGGKGWDSFLASKLEFMGKNYGPRRGPLGVLLLPIDIFMYSIGYFGPIPFAFPTPLSLLLPLYAFIQRHRTVTLLLLVAILRFGTWTVSARNTRYLLDIYPVLAVVVAYLLTQLARRSLVRRVVYTIVLVLLVLNLAWQAQLFTMEDPLPVVLGLEDRASYLRDHNDPPYRAIEFLNQLPAESKVLFVGNGQGYYATVDHVADVNHSNWGHLIYRHGEDPVDLRGALEDEGFSHIFFTEYDFLWQMNFDFDEHLARELAAFDEFVGRCTHLVYDAGEDGRVYALLPTCNAAP